LPSVSVGITESGAQTSYGSTTVQLRGLPFGTTLVLIDGRRIETSGLQSGNDFFDLNNIPLAAVERIEVVPDGSSAIYGSDAIAGVVNIVLRKNFEGLEIATKRGGASGTDEWDSSVAWGRRFTDGSVSIIGSYQTRTELDNSQRALTATNDYRPYGGPDNNFAICSPGNVFSANGVTPLPGLGTTTYAAVPVGYMGKPSIQEFRGTAGTLNECPLLGGSSIIPATDRAGVFAQGNYQLAPSVEIFAEFMFSHIRQYEYTGYPGLFGQVGFQQFTVPASNPYNPFGTTVGVTDEFNTLSPAGLFADTEFIRPLLGLRGAFLNDWHWEVAAFESIDSTNSPAPNQISNNTAIQNALNSSNPATALNPFTAAPAAPVTVLQNFFSSGSITFAGRDETVQGFLRGIALHLPSGPVQVVVGSEFDRDTLSSDYINFFAPPNTRATYHRDNNAVFAEARIPIVANHAQPDLGERLALTIAGRHDDYSDFGVRNTPQLGAEWRPGQTLLVRATYAEAFKAPPLTDLYTPQMSVQSGVVDPITGQQDVITEISGGNPHLRPETGQSHTLGLVYSSDALPGLQASVTYWDITLDDTIESVQAQFIANNANLFPGDVIRGPSGPNGQIGPITEVIDDFVNFGSIDVRGLDYRLSYRWNSRAGSWLPSLTATQTDQYLASLVPGGVPTDRVSRASNDGNWAPRWKGVASLGWTLGPLGVTADSRCVGRYLDYNPLPNGTVRPLGNFCLYDANVRYAIGDVLASDNRILRGVEVQVGGVNLFDRLPQYSNSFNEFVGYDPTQADIRGRFLYAQIRARF
jgi:iron complex outermembrane receptor protein